MLGSIFRNYKNAGCRVGVALCVQTDPESKEFPPLFVHGGTGLEIHRMAAAAHREILRQMRASPPARRPGERFEDIAWKVAAFTLVEAVPQLRKVPAAQVPKVIPFTCFIAEYLSKTYREKEDRDVCISADGDVFIQSFAGMHTDAKTLGKYLAP